MFTMHRQKPYAGIQKMKATLTDEQGIQAIIALQKMAGINETEDQARTGWNAMSKFDKQQTEDAHRSLCGGFNAQGKDNIN